MLARVELGFDPRLDGSQAELFQARDLSLGELLVGELRKRGPAPERERLGQLSEVATRDSTFQAPAVELALLDTQGGNRELG